MGTYITNNNTPSGNYTIYSTDAGDFTTTISGTTLIVLSTNNLGGKSIDISQFANANLQIYDYSESKFIDIILDKPIWSGSTLDISNCTNYFILNSTYDSVNLSIPGPPRAIDTDLDANLMSEISPARVWYTDGEQVTVTSGFTSNWVDLCSEIDMRGYTHLNIFATLDINDSQGARIRALGKYEFGGTSEFNFSIESINPSNVKIEPEYIEFNTDLDQLQIIKFQTDGVPYVQLQIMAEVSGSTVGGITDCYINKIWK